MYNNNPTYNIWCINTPKFVLLAVLLFGTRFLKVVCQPPGNTTLNTTEFPTSFGEWKQRWRPALEGLRMFFSWINDGVALLLWPLLDDWLSLQQVRLLASLLATLAVYRLVVQRLKLTWGNAMTIAFFLLLAWGSGWIG